MTDIHDVIFDVLHFESFRALWMSNFGSIIHNPVYFIFDTLHSDKNHNNKKVPKKKLP